MLELTPEGRRIVEGAAARHGVSIDAARAMLEALAAGGGTQAQFSIPELGGMGQWSRGGMVMVGDMFNNGLKARVDALCNDLAGAVAGAFAAPLQSQSQSQSQGGAGAGASLFVAGPSGGWWPAELGRPASVGSQNDMSYAYFPEARRLAIGIGGTVRVYDTGEHRIGGFGQQKSGDRSLTFTSQVGVVRVADLPLVGGALDAAKPVQAAERPVQVAEEPVRAAERPTPESRPAPTPAPKPAAGVAGGADDLIAQIERLAGLRDRSILTAEEFEAKKAELLARI